MSVTSRGKAVDWVVRSQVTERVEQLSREELGAYRAHPLLVEEHANTEKATAQGGYGRRQLYELVQNAADELLTQPGGRIQVLLTERALYCANEGTPITPAGVNALMMSGLSPKVGAEIGRFGLGFKSVLAITDRPLFMCRTGSFRFDPENAEREILRVAPLAEKIPHLRTAVIVDPAVEAELDADLGELMSWATTVVKLPLDKPRSVDLHEDMEKFPAEFLLFSSHVGRLELVDRERGFRRVILAQTDSNRTMLTLDGEIRRWQLFKVSHSPSTAAFEDAGDIAGRETVPLVWAVPDAPSRGRGQFWAFFPTTMETTLTGIVNAPWKTNSDRQNLLVGPFNEELLEVLSGLVVDSLPALLRPDDPGRMFDVLPARGREAPSWADAEITDRIFDRARSGRSIPDQDGVLQVPATMHVAPDDVPEEALETWASYDARPRTWCHHSALTRERRSRVVRLVEDSQVATRRAWLEALAADHSPAASIAALKTLDALLSTARPAEAREAKGSAIVLTAEGDLVPPDPAALFSNRTRSNSELAAFVHPEVEEDPDAAKVLSSLGIGDVDQAAEYGLYLDSLKWGSVDWDEFWSISSSLDARRAATLIDERDASGSVRIRTRAGTWEPRSRVLLPGPIVGEDSSADAESLVDVQYHATTIQLLLELGVVASPSLKARPSEESWYRTYSEEAFRKFAEATRHLARKPQLSALALDERPTVGPLDPILRLTEPARARFTSALLSFEPDTGTWAVRHSTRPEYPVIDLDDPVTWIVRRHGRLETSLGPRTVEDAVAPALIGYAALLPVAGCSLPWAERLSLPSKLDSLTEPQWQAMTQLVLTLEHLDGLPALYLAASKVIPAPELLRCQLDDRLGTAAPDQVTAVHDAATEEALAEAAVPYLRFETKSDAASIRAAWGLATSEGVVESRIVSTQSADPEPLVDAYPGLRPFLPRSAPTMLVRCSELGRETVGPAGRRIRPLEFALDGQTFYWLDDGDDRRLVTLVSGELQLGLAPEDLNSILANSVANRVRDLIAEVRAIPTPGGKLLHLIGREALREGVRADVLTGVERSEGPLDDDHLARLAEAVFGVDLFKEFKGKLEEASLDPPVAWAGSRAAHRFVNELDLPPEYAGFEEPRRNPLWEVDGPTELPVLHPFQQDLTTRIRQLALDPSRKRALLSLPTGAGKTRVAVQALIEAFKAGEVGSPILWIAPTVELCEQAVQTWAYVWRAIGPRERLNLNRLSESNEAEELTSGLQVVVATDAKMGVVIDKPRYEWLSDAAFVVVDEAHGSTETGYTKILHWLGLGPDQRKDRCVLLGLTATPFKGTSEEATSRLVARYGRRRLDEGVLGEEPYRELQALGVLAQASQRVLGGATVELTFEEAEAAKRTNRLPPKIEDELSSNEDRNETILRTILELPRDWKILLFAASVSHAEQMAAILTMRGVPAAPVSAGTNPAARRYYVRQFNNGPLRVLTNYGVLAEGFDAPSVRAVIVGRLTLSPNAYQQMIGRGLRGPKNGGKERCLIVNVADNVLHFGGKLAFEQDFDYLFDAEATAPV